MRDLIKKILREESESMDMMHFWNNKPDTEEMDDFMWYMIDYVDYPSDGNYKRIKTFIKSLIRYGLIGVDFYLEMYRWLNRRLGEISTAEKDFQLSLDYVGGDDSYSDWKWHVLSLGKENFERLKEGSDDTIEFVESIQPIESFNYAWPHPYDFRRD